MHAVAFYLADLYKATRHPTVGGAVAVAGISTDGEAFKEQNGGPVWILKTPRNCEFSYLEYDVV